MRSVWLDKGCLELSDRLDRRVRLDSIFRSRALVGDDFSIVPAIGVCLGSIRVTANSEFILFLTTNAKLGRQLVGRDAHDFACCVVGNGRRFQSNILHLQTLHHVPKSPNDATLLHGFWHGNELLPHRSSETNGHVGKGFGTTRNHHIGMTRHNLFGSSANGSIGTDAGLCNRVSSNVHGQTSINGSLASNIAGTDFLNDIAGNDVVNFVLGEGSFSEEALNGEFLQINGEFILVDCRSHGKGKSNSRHDHDILHARWPC
mmetsp:Transcript_10655/g.17634  ORF Transcript_10655/g.17634 Transcript_10655/m.17634 type:complete len:260 (+) Transcript_10655:596-1375(+)